MSLDWEQFKEIIEYKSNDNDKHTQLMKIVNQKGFLIQFLTQLSKELKEIKTTSEIADKFPQAGQLLTKAATHPYFGCELPIAQLLVNCLINYSKLDLTPSNEASLNSSTHNNKSITWCIVRLRRFIIASQQENEQGKGTQIMIRKISELLDAKVDRLSPQKITRLADKCLSLAHTEEARSIIQKLVAYALVDCTSSTHFDCPRPLLSDEFIYELANSDTQQCITLRTQYLSWPKELKQNLLICYEELLEFEIVELIEKYITTTKYIPIESLEAQFMQTDLIQSLLHSPVLVQKALNYLSNYVIHYQHWNLVRLSQCLNHILISPLNQRCKPLIKSVNLENIKVQEVHEILMNYIFGDGSMIDFSNRRNEAWCLSLSFHRFTWHCVYEIVQWCKTDKLWSQQMEHTLVYLNWMIYPSLDNRESESLSFLRQWIQTCCGNNILCDELPKRWHNLLNGNGVLIACFVTSIFFSEDHFHVDQQKSLIRSIFVQRQEGPQDIHGNTKKNDPDTALVYLFLDYLNDMELYADLYPLATFDIKIIKNYMVEKYLS